MVHWTVAALALCLITMGLYAPVWGHAFVEFDDPLYVTRNARVQAGLTLENIGWAFTTSEAFIWHPLTWLSYLLDASWYGTSRAGPWLLTNLSLHALNVFLLFAALRSLLTQAAGARIWPCALAVALFAFHPIQVEAVAWVSARKELLAGSFLLLTILAYAHYARRPDAKGYAWLLIASALGYMAKGSHVALPVALLLLDYWPLDRLHTGPGFWRSLGRLSLEKLPLLALSLGVVAVNLLFVSQTHNVWITDPDLFARVAGSLANLLSYVGRLLWPTELAIVYPNALQSVVNPASATKTGVVVLVLMGVSAIAAWAGQKRGYLLAGWLWFLGMLLPMAGLIPMGLRTPHDRYAYIPVIGLAVAVGFGVCDFGARTRLRRCIAAAAVVAALVALIATAREQITVWRGSLPLFDHALRVTEDNAIVHNARGIALARQGDIDSALEEFAEALRVHPKHASANNSLGYLLVQNGATQAGILHLKQALEVRPRWTRASINLGKAQLQNGAPDEAVSTFERAAEYAPDAASVRAALGVALLRAGRRADAGEAFRHAIRIDPEDETLRASLKAIEMTTEAGVQSVP